MHLVQTPGETVYEIKLADLLCSLALEPQSFLKHFAKETSVEVQKNPTQNQQIQNKKNTHLVVSLRAHVIQMRKKERSEERRKNTSQGFRKMVTIQALIIRFLFMSKFLLAELGLCFPNIY